MICGKVLIRVDVADRKAVLSPSIGVQAQPSCTIYLKFVTVRIIAVSNPLELQRVPVCLMCDNCQGDRHAVTVVEER